MTERLYYTDSYRREFQARIVERCGDGSSVCLDRTLFYPASGGQPFDAGSIAGVAVVEVVDEEERIAHRLAAPLTADGEVAGEIDWARRFDHMQQHSGQHLLSAVFEELFGLHTVSFHLGAESPPSIWKAAPWRRARWLRPNGARIRWSPRIARWTCGLRTRARRRGCASHRSGRARCDGLRS